MYISAAKVSFVHRDCNVGDCKSLGSFFHINRIDFVHHQSTVTKTETVKLNCKLQQRVNKNHHAIPLIRPSISLSALSSRAHAATEVPQQMVVSQSSVVRALVAHVHMLQLKYHSGWWLVKAQWSGHW